MVSARTQCGVGSAASHVVSAARATEPTRRRRPAVRPSAARAAGMRLLSNALLVLLVAAGVLQGTCEEPRGLVGVLAQQLFPEAFPQVILTPRDAAPAPASPSTPASTATHAPEDSSIWAYNEQTRGQTGVPVDISAEVAHSDDDGDVTESDDIGNESPSSTAGKRKKAKRGKKDKKKKKKKKRVNKNTADDVTEDDAVMDLDEENPSPARPAPAGGVKKANKKKNKKKKNKKKKRVKRGEEMPREAQMAEEQEDEEATQDDAASPEPASDSVGGPGSESPPDVDVDVDPATRPGSIAAVFARYDALKPVAAVRDRLCTAADHPWSGLAFSAVAFCLMIQRVFGERQGDRAYEADAPEIVVARPCATKLRSCLKGSRARWAAEGYPEPVYHNLGPSVAEAPADTGHGGRRRPPATKRKDTDNGAGTPPDSPVAAATPPTRSQWQYEYRLQIDNVRRQYGENRVDVKRMIAEVEHYQELVKDVHHDVQDAVDEWKRMERDVADAQDAAGHDKRKFTLLTERNAAAAKENNALKATLDDVHRRIEKERARQAAAKEVVAAAAGFDAAWDAAVEGKQARVAAQASRAVAAQTRITELQRERKDLEMHLQRAKKVAAAAKPAGKKSRKRTGRGGRDGKDGPSAGTEPAKDDDAVSASDASGRQASGDVPSP